MLAFSVIPTWITNTVSRREYFRSPTIGTQRATGSPHLTRNDHSHLELSTRPAHHALLPFDNGFAPNLDNAEFSCAAELATRSEPRQTKPEVKAGFARVGCNEMLCGGGVQSKDMGNTLF